MYDPSIGRWLGEDPIGFDGGDVNLYRYVHNAPTIHTDPSGLQQRTTPNILDQLRRWEDYRRGANSHLNFQEWLAREEGRPATPFVPPQDTPLGPTQAQRQRELAEQQTAQAQTFRETPVIRELSAFERQLLNQQIRRVQLDLMYYEFWFYHVPGAMGGFAAPLPAPYTPGVTQWGAQTTQNGTAGTTSVWRVNPFVRGRILENTLGQNLPQNFPTIDRFHNGVATSIKSMDLAAPTYASPQNITTTGQGYINAVRNFRDGSCGDTVITPNQVTGRALDLAIPSVATAPQRAALQGLVQYGQQQGVVVNIIEVP